MNSVTTFEDLLRDPSLYAEVFDLLHARSHSFCCKSDLECKSNVDISVTVKTYQAVIGEILTAESNPEDGGYYLCLTNVPSDEFNEESYIDISLHSLAGDSAYSTAFQDWGSLREMRVEVKDVQLSRAQILAELLWDCTFWGNSQQDVWDERDKLKTSISEVSRGDCVSFDSFEDLEQELDNLK
jgi:hypothetical protein